MNIRTAYLKEEVERQFLLTWDVLRGHIKLGRSVQMMPLREVALKGAVSLRAWRLDGSPVASVAPHFYIMSDGRLMEHSNGAGMFRDFGAYVDEQAQQPECCEQLELELTELARVLREVAKGVDDEARRLRASDELVAHTELSRASGQDAMRRVEEARRRRMAALDRQRRNR